MIFPIFGSTKVLEVGERIRQALEERSAPWRLRSDGGVVRPPLAMAGHGQPALDPILEAYRASPAKLADLLDLTTAEKQILVREEALRAAARAGRPGLERAAALLGERPMGVPPGAGYFSREACWARVHARCGLMEPLADWEDLPVETFRYEVDLMIASAERSASLGARAAAAAAFLDVPVIIEAGALFYRAADTWLRLKDGVHGLPVARFGIDFFRARGEPFKAQEMLLKAAFLAEYLAYATDSEPSFDEALSHVEALVSQAEGPLLAEGVKHAFRIALRPNVGQPARLEKLAQTLARRDSGPLAELAAQILETPGGGGDPVQRAALSALLAALTQPTETSITIPRGAIASPALFGALLSRQLPDAHDVRAVRLAAYSSGFEDVAACGNLLARLLDQAQGDEISAISAFISRRHGARFLRTNEITAVVGCRNVGDTVLYIAGLAAFARASGCRVYVHHREMRKAIADFFGHLPELVFEALPDDVDVHPSLGLNRLGVGTVAGFYEVPWFWPRDQSRLAPVAGANSYLLQKIRSVMASGAELLVPNQATPSPPLRAPDVWVQRGAQRFDELGLPYGQTVLIAPLANTLFSLTVAKQIYFESFWIETIKEFQRHNIHAVVNNINNGRSESLLSQSGVPNIELDLREVPSFLASAGFFAGVRSGLCDLVALARIPGLRAQTVYMKGAEHCVGLDAFGVGEVVYDIGSSQPEGLARSFVREITSMPPII